MFTEYLTKDDVYEYMQTQYDLNMQYADRELPLVIKKRLLVHADSWNVDNVQDYKNTKKGIIIVMKNGEKYLFDDFACTKIDAMDIDWIKFVYEKMTVQGLGEMYKAEVLDENRLTEEYLAYVKADLESRSWKGTTIHIDLTNNTVSEGEPIYELRARWAREAGEVFEACYLNPLVDVFADNEQDDLQE